MFCMAALKHGPLMWAMVFNLGVLLMGAVWLLLEKAGPLVMALEPKGRVMFVIMANALFPLTMIPAIIIGQFVQPS
jgi:hypothetical protein